MRTTTTKRGWICAALLAALLPGIARAQYPASNGVACARGTVRLGSQCVESAASAWQSQGEVWSRHEERTDRHGTERILLLTFGAVLAGGGWLASGVLGLFAGVDLSGLAPHEERGEVAGVSWIPIGGPWIAMSVRSHLFDGDGDAKAAWVVLGLMQALGVGLLSGGLLLDSGSTTQVAIVPQLGPGSIGLAAAGAF